MRRADNDDGSNGLSAAVKGKVTKASGISTWKDSLRFSADQRKKSTRCRDIFASARSGAPGDVLDEYPNHEKGGDW